MSTERFTRDDGVVIERKLLSDDRRELAVARVVSLSPPAVKVPGRKQPVRIHARTEGLTVSVDDWVAIFRVEQGVVAFGKIEVLG